MRNVKSSARGTVTQQLLTLVLINAILPSGGLSCKMAEEAPKGD